MEEKYIYLRKEQIIELNYESYRLFGGNFTPPENTRNGDSLIYLIDIVQRDDYYPTINDKAAVYAFNISSRHVFSDGNKRTSLNAALLFLELNFYRLSDSVTDEMLIKLGLSIGSAEMTQEDVSDWFKNNIVEILLEE